MGALSLSPSLTRSVCALLSQPIKHRNQRKNSLMATCESRQSGFLLLQSADHSWKAFVAQEATRKGSSDHSCYWSEQRGQVGRGWSEALSCFQWKDNLHHACKSLATAFVNFFKLWFILKIYVFFFISSAARFKEVCASAMQFLRSNFNWIASCYWVICPYFKPYFYDITILILIISLQLY